MESKRQGSPLAIGIEMLSIREVDGVQGKEGGGGWREGEGMLGWDDGEKPASGDSASGYFVQLDGRLLTEIFPHLSSTPPYRA